MAFEQNNLVINGWTVFCHPLFLEELSLLVNQVENLKQKDPQNYKNKNATKRLAAIAKLAFEVIPKDPTNPAFRQGSTLGKNHKHWFRAKFFQQYRLFFRFDTASKIIVFAWVNDEKMLSNGCPPDNWTSLLKEEKSEKRLNPLSKS